MRATFRRHKNFQVQVFPKTVSIISQQHLYRLYVVEFRKSFSVVSPPIKVTLPERVKKS